MKIEENFAAQYFVWINITITNATRKQICFMLGRLSPSPSHRLIVNCIHSFICTLHFMDYYKLYYYHYDYYVWLPVRLCLCL